MATQTRSRFLTQALASLALVSGLAFTQGAQAVPCGSPILTGGIVPASTCRNGPDGDATASASELNAGNFFGINTWNLLDSTSDGVDSSVWKFWNLDGQVNPNGTHIGLIELASGIWSQYSSLTIVLNGRGGAWDKDVKWSAYLLNPGENWLIWSYDIVHKLGSASIFGDTRVNVPPTSVPEPAAMVMLLAGLGIGTLVLRRRVSR